MDQRSFRREWYSSIPPTSSVNSISPGVDGGAPFPPAVILTGPWPPLIVEARLLPATESALMVELAGVALNLALLKLNPVDLLWKGSESSSSLEEKSLLRFSFLYSSIRRRKSKMNFLMISIRCFSSPAFYFSKFLRLSAT